MSKGLIHSGILQRYLRAILKPCKFHREVQTYFDFSVQPTMWSKASPFKRPSPAVGRINVFKLRKTEKLRSVSHVTGSVATIFRSVIPGHSRKYEVYSESIINILCTSVRFLHETRQYRGNAIWGTGWKNNLQETAEYGSIKSNWFRTELLSKNCC